MAAARVSCLSYLLALSRDNLARPNENRPTGDGGLHTTTNDPCIVPRHNTMFFLFFFLTTFRLLHLYPPGVSVEHCPLASSSRRRGSIGLEDRRLNRRRRKPFINTVTGAGVQYIILPGHSGDFPNGLNIIHAMRVADKGPSVFSARHARRDGRQTSAMPSHPYRVSRLKLISRRPHQKKKKKPPPPRRSVCCRPRRE